MASLRRGQNQSRVDKFSRPKFQLIIRKRRLELHRAGRLIDFVVHDREARLRRACVVFPRSRAKNFQSAIRAALVQNFLQILFGQT